MHDTRQQNSKRLTIETEAVHVIDSGRLGLGNRFAHQPRGVTAQAFSALQLPTVCELETELDID
ncbi:hypothetical protein AWB75_06151 [Caballeronia catudaia]|uniref:Uncharacterized protein n=2 Tax=Caballeronia catudaia TaxID=1777136 RepID=A0A158D513_9BURK|nr:hypothetical protein AWB75_06151 [Caballeronia catudaia]